MRSSMLVLVLAGWACRPTPNTTLPAAANVAAVRCALAPEEDRLAEWRRVQADGFSFCVPLSWTPAGSAGLALDAPSWATNGVSVRWAAGDPDAGACEIGVLAPVGYPPVELVAEQAVTLGNRAGVRWTARQGRGILTGVRWAERIACLRGTARSPGEAVVLDTIFRTVRFAGR